jgi:DNA polymerase-1
MYAWYLSQQIGDETAADVFRAGKDLHAQQAIRIHEALGWEVEFDENGELLDKYRQIGKTSNFAALYSGGVPTIIRQLGCDRGTARAISEAFHEDNPNLGRWEWVNGRRTDPAPHTLNGMLVSTLRERGFIRTLWGRHLHPDEDRKALNALIQGGAADLMKRAMVQTWEYLQENNMQSHMVLSVHDEIGLDCVEEEVDQLREALPTLMDDPILSAVLPIEVDMKTSTTTWAEAA